MQTRGKECGIRKNCPQSVGKGNQRKSVVVLELYEEPVRLQLTWFNMPFLRSTLKKGSVFIFRGKIQEKSGRLVMEQPEIFTPAAYHELLQIFSRFMG